MFAIAAFSSFKDDSNADQVLKLIEHVKRGCDLYYFDVGSFAMEYLDGAYSNYMAHNLSRSTGSGQWNGSYIRQLLTNRDNPFGGTIPIYNYLDYANAFDLNSDGVIATRCDGNFIVFLSISVRVAKRINYILDGNRDAKNWLSRGRVKYSKKAAVSQSICLGDETRRDFATAYHYAIIEKLIVLSHAFTAPAWELRQPVFLKSGSFIPVSRRESVILLVKLKRLRRGGRAVECGGLENRYGATHREFESHPLRQLVFLVWRFLAKTSHCIL